MFLTLKEVRELEDCCVLIAGSPPAMYGSASGRERTDKDGRKDT